MATLRAPTSAQRDRETERSERRQGSRVRDTNHSGSPVHEFARTVSVC
jgi:hypothetical protein